MGSQETAGAMIVALVVGAAGGEPALAPAQGLHGNGPFGLMRAVDLDGDGWMELLVEDPRGRLVLIEPTARSEPARRDRVLSVAFGDLRDVAMGDLDRDGTLEVVSAGDDAIRWIRRERGDGMMGSGGITGPWQTHELAVSPGASAVALGDFDRDGDLDCLGADATGLDLAWYRNDSADGSVAFVADLSIALGAPALGLAACDVNRDGWLDALSLSSRGLGVHLRDPGMATFTTVMVATGLGDPRQVVVLDGEGDGDLDALIVGDDAVLLATNVDGRGGDWVVATVADGLASARRAHVGDLDRDGRVDLVVEVGGKSAVWLSDLAGTERSALLIAVHSYGPIALVDMDLDGDEDLIAALGAGALLWRENEAMHRSDALPRRGDVEADVDGAFNVSPGDLDGDGDVDLVSAAFNGDAIAWHENLGDGAFVRHVVLEGTNGPVAVVCADFDLDGKLDIASASTNDDTIHWHRNLGGSPTVFETAVVSADADGVFSLGVGDLDRDGRIDLVSAEKNTDRVRWFRNAEIGGEVSFSAGLVKGGVRGAFNVAVGDVDGDGWMDVVSASRDDDAVRVLRNLGGEPLAFESIVLSDRADEAAGVAIADLDGDGDLDVASASRRDGKVRWFENTGASPTAFVERTVDGGVAGATWVRAADLDGDGDLDLVSAARDSGVVRVAKNNGGSPVTFSNRSLAAPAAFLSCVEPADLDGDGKVDLAIAAVMDDVVAWYRNEGGVFAIGALSIAPASAGAWEVAGLLTLNAASRARAGEGDIVLSSVTLRFEDDASNPLTSEQLAGLVQRLTLHLDDGDREFEPLGDAWLVSLVDVELSAGELTLEIPEGARGFGPGRARTFHVGVRMAAGAGNQGMTDFRVRVVGQDAQGVRHGSAVSIEDARIVGTPVVSATCPADVTGSNNPDDPGFGEPDGRVNQTDMLYYTQLFGALDPSADLTSTIDRGDPAYGIPDGIVDALDFTYFVDRFDEGC